VRVATRYARNAPAPLLPRGRPSASRAAEETHRSSSFPRPIRSHGHRCPVSEMTYTVSSGTLSPSIPYHMVTVAPASRVKAAVSKAAWWRWPLTFWPWKWCPSYIDVAISVPILVFLDLSVLNLGPMYATDRHQTLDRQTSDAHHRLMSPTYRGGGIIMQQPAAAKRRSSYAMLNHLSHKYSYDSSTHHCTSAELA